MAGKTKAERLRTYKIDAAYCLARVKRKEIEMEDIIKYHSQTIVNSPLYTNVKLERDYFKEEYAKIQDKIDKIENPQRYALIKWLEK